MKIVLNKTERESFKEFLMEYAHSCIHALENIGTEDAEIMLSEARGLSDEELVEFMIKDLDLEPLVSFKELEDGACEVEVSMDILVAYNKYMAFSIKTMIPYSSKIASAIMKHEGALKALALKIKSFKFGAIGTIVKGLITMVGLEGLYADLKGIYEEFKSDEETQRTLRVGAGNFEMMIQGILTEEEK